MAQDYKWRGIAGDYVELSDPFFSSSRCRRRLALHYYIFWVNNRYINESLAFSPG